MEYMAALLQLPPACVVVYGSHHGAARRGSVGGHAAAARQVREYNQRPDLESWMTGVFGADALVLFSFLASRLVLLTSCHHTACLVTISLVRAIRGKPDERKKWRQCLLPTCQAKGALLRHGGQRAADQPAAALTMSVGQGARVTLESAI